MADNQVDLKLNLDFKGVNDALYQMIGEFNGTDKEFQKIADNIQKNAKKLEASILVFGPASKQAAAAQKALQANMVSLVANGVNPEIAAIGTLSQNFNSLNGIIEKTQVATNKTTTTINAHTSSLKQNNQKYTAFALILQDLPFGFRAIQNNLPALMGSFAGVGGAAYLAFSAIIAGFTFYDEAQRKAAAETKNLKKEQQSLNDGIIQSTASARTQGLLLQQYVTIARDTTLSDKTRNEALKKANELYGTHNEKLTLTNINTKAVKESLDGYIESLIKLAVAEKYASQIADNIIEQGKLKSQIDEKDIVRQKLLTEIRGKQTNKSRDLVDVYDDLFEVNAEINKIDNARKGLLATNITLTDNYTKALKEAAIASATFGEEEKGGKAAKDDSYINLLRSRIELTKEDLDTRLQLQKDLLANETENERNAIRQSTLSRSQKAKAIENINETMINKIKLLDEQYYKDSYELEKQDFAVRIKLSEQNLEDQKIIYGQQLMSLKERLDDGIISERQYLTEYAEIKNQIVSVDKKINDQLIKQQEDLTNTSIYFTDQRIKAVQTEANASIKANKGNYQAQKQALEEAIVKLAVFRMAGIGGAEAMIKLNEAISGTKAQLDGLVDPLENFNNSLNNIINQTLENMAIAVGESLGKMLSGGGGGIKELMNNFLSIMAEGLIQIGKLAIQTGVAILGIKEALKTLNPYVAIAAGIALVALGTYVKGRLSKSADSMGGTKKFANGGIISGPTMGLMGEYPGASHNPEVVAPLDKLKSLMGGGSGTLEARISGNDLLILMNKAGRNNNNTF